MKDNQREVFNEVSRQIVEDNIKIKTRITELREGYHRYLNGCGWWDEGSSGELIDLLLKTIDLDNKLQMLLELRDDLDYEKSLRYIKVNGKIDVIKLEEL